MLKLSFISKTLFCLQIPRSALVKGVVGFVRSLESVEDLDSVGSQVFE